MVNLSHLPSESAGHTYSPLILREALGGCVKTHMYMDYVEDEDAERLPYMEIQVGFRSFSSKMRQDCWHKPHPFSADSSTGCRWIPASWGALEAMGSPPDQLCLNVLQYKVWR